MSARSEVRLVEGVWSRNGLTSYKFGVCPDSFRSVAYIVAISWCGILLGLGAWDWGWVGR